MAQQQSVEGVSHFYGPNREQWIIIFSVLTMSTGLIKPRLGSYQNGTVLENSKHCMLAA